MGEKIKLLAPQANDLACLGNRLIKVEKCLIKVALFLPFVAKIFDIRGKNFDFLPKNSDTEAKNSDILPKNFIKSAKNFAILPKIYFGLKNKDGEASFSIFVKP
uniref:hypothetical protein n=1 Tax=Ornithobacterium rhinotracheale TaxID=28251 RepID=UPI0039A58271